jgi:hypothetical protein
VTGRDGAPTRVLSLNSKVKSPDPGVQQLAFQNAYMGVEPVMYQRMWIKFDAATLTRAKRIGARDFWLMFWETKAEPDYRIRTQLQYSEAGGLYWQVQGDLLTNANAVWSSTLETVPVVIAEENSALGWHKVEIWMDRPNGRFKAAIDGRVLVDRSGTLEGASRSIVDQLKLAMVYGAGYVGEILFDDLEIWSSPPVDAWTR